MTGADKETTRPDKNFGRLAAIYPPPFVDDYGRNTIEPLILRFFTQVVNLVFKFIGQKEVDGLAKDDKYDVMKKLKTNKPAPWS